jgi:hypothetical protein
MLLRRKATITSCEKEEEFRVERSEWLELGFGGSECVGSRNEDCDCLADEMGA